MASLAQRDLVDKHFLAFRRVRSDKSRLLILQRNGDCAGLFSSQQFSESDELLFDPFNRTVYLFGSTAVFTRPVSNTGRMQQVTDTHVMKDQW